MVAATAAGMLGGLVVAVVLLAGLGAFSVAPELDMTEAVERLLWLCEIGR